MKLHKLIQARQTLGQYTNIKVNTLLAYKILKFLKASEIEEAFFQEKFRSIINEYCQKDKSGQPVITNGNYSIIPEHIEECRAAIAELDETDVEIPANIQFKIAELEQFEMSVKELVSLEELIQEG